MIRTLMSGRYVAKIRSAAITKPINSTSSLPGADKADELHLVVRHPDWCAMDEPRGENGAQLRSRLMAAPSIVMPTPINFNAVPSIDTPFEPLKLRCGKSQLIHPSMHFQRIVQIKPNREWRKM